MTARHLRRAVCGAALIVLVTGTPVAPQIAEDNLVLRWNAAALEAIRRSALAPPAVARALAILHTCIYDAWAVYDPIASDAEALLEHARRAGLRVDRISEVTMEISPAMFA